MASNKPFDFAQGGSKLKEGGGDDEVAAEYGRPLSWFLAQKPY